MAQETIKIILIAQNMELNKKLLLELGFIENTKNPKIAPYYMELGNDIVLEISTYPTNLLTLNIVLTDGTIIVTKASTLDDIITIGKLFKGCIIDTPY